MESVVECKKPIHVWTVKRRVTSYGINATPFHPSSQRKTQVRSIAFPGWRSQAFCSRSDQSSRSETMAAPVAFSTRSIILAMRVVGFLTATLTMIWNMNFRGGLSFRGETSFNLHPVLMVLGFILPGGEGILVFKGGLNGSKCYTNTGHLILNTVALVLGSWGVFAAFKYQIEMHADHLYSIHGWIGVATIVLFVIHWVVTFVTFWYPGASEGKKSAIRPWLGFLGRFIVCMALATAETGLVERVLYLEKIDQLKHYSIESTLINILGALIPLLGLVIIYASVQPKPKVIDEADAAGVYAPLNHA